MHKVIEDIIKKNRDKFDYTKLLVFLKTKLIFKKKGISITNTVLLRESEQMRF